MAFARNTPESVTAAGFPVHTVPALVTLCVSILAAQLDMTVVNLAVKPIGGAFGAGMSTMQWLVDAYNLTYASLLLTGGLLADLYGRRLVFVAGSGLFSAGSLMCAYAPTVAVLLGGRVAAGAGAALMLPASLALMRIIWVDERARAFALGVWAGCHGLALAIGPVLGGWLIQSFGWSSIFFLTAPLAALVIPLAGGFIPESADREGRVFDGAGQTLGFIALASFTLAAIEAHRSVHRALYLFVFSAAALAAFILIERRRGRTALVPLYFFRIPRFLGAVLATVAMTFGMYATLFLLPLTWLATQRMDVVAAGVALLPCAGVFVVTSPFSGRILSILGLRAVTALGIGAIIAGIIAIAAGAARAYWISGVGLALTGLGMGLSIGPLMGAAVNAVSSARSGSSGALINVARMVGATLGVAVVGSLYTLLGGGYHGLALALGAAAAVQCVLLSFGLWNLGRAA